MQGRIGSVLGNYSSPSDQAAGGAWRLSEVFAAKRGAYGYSEYAMSSWPTIAINVAWPMSYYWPYETLDTADATENGSATFTASVSSPVADVSFAYQWQRSVDGGSTWSDVAGQSGTGVASDYYQGGSPAQVSLSLTGQTTAEDGHKYRLVATSGLREASGSAGTLRVDTVSLTWESQPSSATVANGNAFSATAWASAVGQTYGTNYSPTLQWQKSVDGGTTWVDEGSPQTTQNNLFFYVTPSDNGNQYRVIASLGGQTLTSSVATLTVT